MKSSSLVSLSVQRHKETENKLILQALHQKKQPLTRRKLSELTGLELPTLCRALYDLTHKAKVLYVAAIRPCPITNKWVFHYYFKNKDYQNGKTEN